LRSIRLRTIPDDTAYLTLAFRGALPWWITILVLSRDAAILITALLMSWSRAIGRFTHAFGKASTFLQVPQFSWL